MPLYSANVSPVEPVYWVRMFSVVNPAPERVMVDLLEHFKNIVHVRSTEHLDKKKGARLSHERKRTLDQWGIGEL